MFLNMKSIVKKTVTAALIGSIAFTLALCGSSSGGQTTTAAQTTAAAAQESKAEAQEPAPSGISARQSS